MTQDEQAIHAIVKSMEDAWNRGAGTAFAADMADDADFIDVLGRHHTGKGAVEAGHKMIFSTIYKGSRVAYTLEKLRLLSGDVAVAFIRARLQTTLAKVDDANRNAAEHGALHEEGARPTLILQKHGGGWKVAAFQNTRIA